MGLYFDDTSGWGSKPYKGCLYCEAGHSFSKKYRTCYCDIIQKRVKHVGECDDFKPRLLKESVKQLDVGKNENMDIEQIYKQYHELEEKGCFYCLLCKFYDKDKDYCSYRKKQPERYYHCPYAEYTDLVWYIILRVLINLLKQLETKINAIDNLENKIEGLDFQIEECKRKWRK